MSSRKEFSLVFTVQKLRKSLEDLSRTTEGLPISFHRSMVLLPMGRWRCPTYGYTVGASGDRTTLGAEARNQLAHDAFARTVVNAEAPLILQFHWDFSRDDPLLFSLEATVFPDGRAIGG